MSDYNINNATVTTTQGSIIKLGVTSNEDATNMVDAFRNSFHNQIGEDKAEMKALKANTRMHLYILLAAFCGISFRLLDPAMKSFLSFVLGEHGLSPAKAGGNLFRPLADMLFGEWNDAEFTDNKGKVKKRKKPSNATAMRTVNGKKQFFVPNRSAEKYAKVARYAQSQGWTPEEMAEKLSLFKGGMAAILTADTSATRATDEAENEVDELVELVYAAAPRSTLDLSDCGVGPDEVDGRKLISLWAEIKDDEVLIRGVLPTSDSALHAYVRKYAKANGNKLLRQQNQSLKQAAA